MLFYYDTAMSLSNVLTGIDIGTDKCVTLIATRDQQLNTLRIVGVSAVPSKGVKKSQIIDLEQVLGVITESVDSAERMAGVEVKSAYISVSGSHISSFNSKGVVAVASPDKEITQLDVARVVEAARAISLPSDREILHIIPKSFSVDSQEGIKDPVGMTGVRLETEAHIITGLSPTLRNIDKCISDLGIKIDGFVFAGLASAEVTLSETEKELGVVSIDIGAGSTALCAYVDGALAYSGTIPVGARHITQDIALGCRVSLDVAEKIKVHLTSDTVTNLTPLSGESKQDFSRRKKQADVLSLKDIGVINTEETISKKAVTEGIIMPRIKEMMELILDQLEKNHLVPLIPAGAVLSGGGAHSIMLVDVAKHVLQLSARVGMPQKIEGLTNDIQDPSFATSLGLIHYAATQQPTRQSGSSLPQFFTGKRFANIGNQVVQGIKSLLP